MTIFCVFHLIKWQHLYSLTKILASFSLCFLIKFANPLFYFFEFYSCLPVVCIISILLGSCPVISYLSYSNSLPASLSISDLLSLSCRDTRMSFLEMHFPSYHSLLKVIQLLSIWLRIEYRKTLHSVPQDSANLSTENSDLVPSIQYLFHHQFQLFWLLW